MEKYSFITYYSDLCTLRALKVVITLINCEIPKFSYFWPQISFYVRTIALMLRLVNRICVVLYYMQIGCISFHIVTVGLLVIFSWTDRFTEKKSFFSATFYECFWNQEQFNQIYLHLQKVLL